MKKKSVQEKQRWRRAWEKANPDKRQRYALKTTYNITPERVEALSLAQGNRCAICEISFDTAQRCVDHDHACCPGRTSCGSCVRGLLCQRCNRALGALRDDWRILRRAISYLVPDSFDYGMV